MNDFGYTYSLKGTDRPTGIYLFLMLEDCELSWQGYATARLYVGGHPTSGEQGVRLLEQFGGELTIWDVGDPDIIGADATINALGGGQYAVACFEAAENDVAGTAAAALVLAQGMIREVEDARTPPPQREE